MEAPGNLSQHIQELDIHGFTIINNVITGKYLIKIREVLTELYHKTPINSNQSTKIQLSDDGAGKLPGKELLRNLPTRNPVFFNLIDSDKILPIIENFLGKNIILGSLNARILPPKAESQKFHSDIPDVLRKADNPLMINAAWVINDFTETNGATEFIPGSHRHPASNCPAGYDAKYIVKATAKAGSVILFNGQCWHRGGKNNSNDFRYAIFGHYRVGYWMRFQWDPHYGFPEEWLEKLNPRQKQLLRMEKGLRSLNAADTYD